MTGASSKRSGEDRRRNQPHENKLANEGFVAPRAEAVIAKEHGELEGYAEAKAKLN
ncbi:hypothetical protein ACNKHP_16290 [Shigella boydii]